MRNLAAKPRPGNAIRLAALALAILVSPGLMAQEPASPASTKDEKSVVAELVEAHNKERAKEGLPPLKLESKLQEAARGHAKDMAEREEMTHEGADGSTPGQRVVNFGYHYLMTGENVARGQRDVPDVMLAWMESPPHKKNVLGDYSEIGVARAEGKDGKFYWCADFGRPIPKFDPATAAADLVKRINDDRSAAKLPALAVEPKLATFAREQSSRLAEKKGQPGVTASFDGLDTRLYPDLAMSTAVGQPDAEAVLKSLRDDPDLKSKVLGQFTRIGVGYATAQDGTPFWCLILANPRNR